MGANRSDHLLYPELRPLLTLQIPDNWERVLVHDGYTVFGVRFYYKGGHRDAVDISFWDNSQKYQTWVYGTTDEEYPTLQKAIERAYRLMVAVERGVHYTDIASVRNEEYGRQLVQCTGIGRGTITRLLDAFGTLQKLQEATLDNLEAVSGIGSDKAWLIASHLYPNVRYHELWDPTKEEWVELYQVPEKVIDQCVKTRTYLTKVVRNKYRLSKMEIEERGLTKERQTSRKGK